LFETKCTEFYLDLFRFEIFIAQCVGGYFFRTQCTYDSILASAPGTPVGECCPSVGRYLAPPLTDTQVILYSNAMHSIGQTINQSKHICMAPCVAN